MATLFTVGVEVQTSAAQQAIARLERSFDAFARSSQTAQGATDKLSRELDGATKEINNFAGEMEVAAKKQQDFERGSLAVAAAMGALAVKAKQYLGAVTQVGQATQQAIAANSTLAKDAKGLDKAFRQLTKELNYSTNSLELNKASYDVLSAGISETADVLNVMKAGVAGAKGGFSDLGTITDAVTTIMNAFGKSSAEAQKIVDMMITTQNDGKIVAAQYGRQIGVVASGAATAGVKLEELNAAVALATVSGVQVSSTFSGLRQAISSIASPSEQAKKMAKELGIEFNQQAIKSKGFAQVLRDVATATKGNAEQIAKLFDSVEARAVIDPILNDLDRYTKMLENQNTTAGAATDAQRKLAGGLTQAQAAFANIKTEVDRDVFAVIEPVVTALVKGTTALGKAFVDLPEPIQKVAIGVGVLGSAVLITTAAIVAFNAIGLTSAAIMGGLATAMGVILSPIGLVVIAVGGLYLAFQQMMDSSEKLRKVMTESVGKMGEVVEKIFNSIGKIVDVLTGKYAAHESQSKGIFQRMGDWFADYVDDTVRGWQMIAAEYERYAIMLERRNGVGSIKGLSITETQRDIEAGDIGGGLAVMAKLTFESQKLQAEIKKAEAEAAKFRNTGMGIPNVALEENIKKMKSQLESMKAAFNQVDKFIQDRNRPKAGTGAGTGSKSPVAIANQEIIEDDEKARKERERMEKELADEQFRIEKEIADRRRQEFEERQRRERDAFQDRRQFEGSSFDQRSNFEMRLFDLQARHQDLLRQQRLDTESDIADAVIRSQKEIEALQIQIERRRLERQFQQEQQAMEVRGLYQQRQFEQAQAGAAGLFNQGQFVNRPGVPGVGGVGVSGVSQSGVLAYTGNTGRGTGPHLDLRGFTSGDRRTRLSPQRLKEIEAMIMAGDRPLSSFPITSGYGPRRAPTPGASRYHPGFDYGTPIGTPLRFKGEIVGKPKTYTDSGGGGKVLEITLPTGEIVQFLHLQKFGDALAKILPTTQPASTGSGGGLSAANSKGAALIQAARVLGINPVDLATIIEFESDGVTHKRGGDGGNYRGLIQFGPNERKQYGYRPDMTFEEMVQGPVVRYFQDRFRGVGMSTQGADLETLYTTVLAGNPKANRNARDSFGTSASSGVKKMTAPGADRDIALRKYFTGSGGGGGSVAAGGVPGGPMAYAQAGIPGVTVSQLDIQSKLNELHFDQSIAIRETALEQAELTQLYEQQAKIVPQMVRDNVNGVKEQIRQTQIESDLLRLQGEEKKNYVAQMKYENLYLNEKVKLEKDIANATNPAEKVALQKALNQLLKEEAEIKTVITLQQVAEDQLEAQRKQTEWADRQVNSLKSMRFALSAMSEEGQMATRMAENMGNTFGDAFTRLITGAGSAQEAFAGFMTGMASVFAQELQRMAATALTNNVLPGLMNLFGGGAASLFGGAFGGGSGFSVGNVIGTASGVSLPGFSIPAFAEGGIVTKPMVGLVGEAGKEAIIPLDKMNGMGGNVVTINVSVNNDGTSVDQQGGSQLGRELESAVVAVLQKQKRPGGLLASVR